MAKTLSDFKKEIASAFVENPEVKQLYGINEDKPKFETYFPAVSVEGVLVYMWAFVSWVIASLFNQHREDVDNTIISLKPHTLRWYVSKVKAYQEKTDGTPDNLPTNEYGQIDSDTYSEIIPKRQIVKYATAQEKNGQISIKVAGQKDGKPCKLDSIANIKYYMSQIKDAGVPVQVYSYDADQIRIAFDIHINPLKITAEEVKGKVIKAVESVVDNLSFNGDCKRIDILNSVKNIDGIEVVYISSFQVNAANDSKWKIVDGYCTPESGYFQVDENNISIRTLQYENGQQI